MLTIVLGTHNRKKGEEMQALLRPAGVRIETLAAYPRAIEVVEDGETFLDNARKKAVEQARHLDRWVLAEDSGLLVDAIDGAPGVYSARFSGPDADDESNNRLLLERLDGVPNERRGAGYLCQMVLADPGGEVRAESRGTCRGRITTEPRGTGGFGYDPLFELLEYHRTFGQMSPAAKSVLSHRARAAADLLPQLFRLADV
jgi:XTP/dITP diphosphohydrolase